MSVLDACVDAAIHAGIASRRSPEWPSSKGEYYALCPFHADTTIGSFSFGDRGYYCFACSASGSLGKLLAHLTGRPYSPGNTPEAVPTRLVPRRPPEPFWKPNVDLLRDYRPLTPEAAAWYRGRGFRDTTVDQYLLGVGVLPASRCPHPRLVLPVYADHTLVALRGRHFGCACDPKATKWLCSKDSRTVLFNLDNVRAGALVIVAESPYSAILAGQEDAQVVGVASTAGAGSWSPAWTAALVERTPRLIVLWYDQESESQAKAQEIARALAAAGAPTRIFLWPPGTHPKTGLDDYMRQGGSLALALHQARVVERPVCSQPLPAKPTPGALTGASISSPPASISSGKTTPASGSSSTSVRRSA